MPASIHTSVLRSITNSWCTSARFQEKVLPCRLCGESTGDSLQHYINCLYIAEACIEHLYRLPLDWGCHENPMKGFVFMAGEVSEESVLAKAVAIDATLH